MFQKWKEETSGEQNKIIDSNNSDRPSSRISQTSPPLLVTDNDTSFTINPPRRKLSTKNILKNIPCANPLLDSDSEFETTESSAESIESSEEKHSTASDDIKTNHKETTSSSTNIKSTPDSSTSTNILNNNETDFKKLSNSLVYRVPQNIISDNEEGEFILDNRESCPIEINSFYSDHLETTSASDFCNPTKHQTNPKNSSKLNLPIKNLKSAQKSACSNYELFNTDSASSYSSGISTANLSKRLQTPKKRSQTKFGPRTITTASSQSSSSSNHEYKIKFEETRPTYSAKSIASKPKTAKSRPASVRYTQNKLVSDSESETSSSADLNANALPKLSKLALRPKTPKPPEFADNYSSENKPPVRKSTIEEYKPEKFASLDVSDEIKEVFEYITSYAPLHINLDFKYKPFTPGYIPIVGDVEAFLKVIPPETLPFSDNGNTPDQPPNWLNLGLSVLDEPARLQSDPAILYLKLRTVDRNFLRLNDDANLIIKTVTNVEKEAHVINKWIDDINMLHAQKSLSITAMEDSFVLVENLTQPWSKKFKKLYNKRGFPNPNLNCNLSQYIELASAMLDIPANTNKIESLYRLFSLYIISKNTQIFVNNNNMVSGTANNADYEYIENKQVVAETNNKGVGVRASAPNLQGNQKSTHY